MDVSIVVTVYKGCIDKALVFKDSEEARKQYLELKKGFNFDEDDIQFFPGVHVKEKGE